MQVPVAQTPKFALKHAPPASKPGDYITLRAEIDCIVAFSACPQDIIPVNVGPLAVPLPLTDHKQI